MDATNDRAGELDRLGGVVGELLVRVEELERALRAMGAVTRAYVGDDGPDEAAELRKALRGVAAFAGAYIDNDVDGAGEAGEAGLVEDLRRALRALAAGALAAAK